jgi:hypothetical protein
MNKVPYSRHLGYQKTIAAVKKQYYWLGMRKEVIHFISRCLECKKVKAKHKHPTIFLHQFPIPEWKWEAVAIRKFSSAIVLHIRSKN